MLVVCPPQHARHAPPHEFWQGRLAPYAETPARAEIILRALAAAGIGAPVAPDDWGLAPVLAVHAADYVDHLRTLYARWIAAGGAPEAAFPSTFPRPGLDRVSQAPLALPGLYCFDMSAPVTEGTYAAALEAAHCAVTAAARLLAGARAAYALCRPPGHHAGPDLMGGYCYFNNAAIAAHYLTQRGAPRVAILDVDVHAGNGTQAVFYERADVLFASIHGSPDWEYPYFSGYADERGAGPGLGFTLNFPLEQGVDDTRYLAVLDAALAHIHAFAPHAVVLSAGFDTFHADPLGRFRLTTPVYHEIGARVAALGAPVLAVQEGGYAVDALGENVVSLLRGLAGT